VGAGWGRGATLLAVVPERHRSEAVRAWAARAEQEGASPGAALDLVDMNLAIDVRSMLGDVRVPTVVLHAAGDRVVRAGSGRALAQAIPGAHLVEKPGEDHAILFARGKVLIRELERLLDGVAPARALTDRDRGDGCSHRQEHGPEGEGFHTSTEANPAVPSTPARSRHSHPSKNQRQGRATMRWSVASAVPSGTRTCSTHQSRPPGRRTRWISRRTAAGSRTLQRTMLETTALTLASGSGSRSAVPSRRSRWMPRRRAAARRYGCIYRFGSTAMTWVPAAR
jgi:hypothetical protein